MKIKTKKFVELDISDNELGKCLFNKVSEILGYGANTSYTVDDEGFTYMGNTLVSNSPQIAAYVKAACYLINEIPYDTPPVQDKYSEKSVAGRVASAIRKAAATNTSNSNKADKEDYLSKTTAG